MKYSLTFTTLLICMNAKTMQNKPDQLNAQVTQILNHAKSRLSQQVNQDLLVIAREADRAKLLQNIKIYYRSGQPQHQTSMWAYLKKPLVNTQKIYAYVQLLRESSSWARKEAERKNTQTMQNLQYEAVDSNMLARTRELWPLKSVQYEFNEMADQLDQIHLWAYNSLSYWNQQNQAQVVTDLQAISADSLAVRRAIATCQQSLETQ